MNKPWEQMNAAERAAAYQDASLRIHDIDWYQFHGVDPRDGECCTAMTWCRARGECLRRAVGAAPRACAA